jgi:hypothetical protein
MTKLEILGTTAKLEMFDIIWKRLENFRITSAKVIIFMA